ncbi:Histone-lysine N-methyltransferase SETDB1-B [Nibea albiflora]|uniref:Histone-lysine N-methyltransferase SETDB1-B n=1 Tax=Nibea albiflora TaxID=240163 RepID=A0ACB7EUB1_NIBAL|nr:Histone-lysine N-methyltransferase SETDB1-B [Nibea albiflora]
MKLSLRAPSVVVYRLIWLKCTAMPHLFLLSHDVIMEVDETTTRISGKRFEKTDLSDSAHESHPSTDETPSKKTQFEDTDSLRVVKKAVVVLTRLPEYKISALRPPTPQQFYSEDESFSSSDSDMQLVFLDDHIGFTSVYVGLPLLHLVCRPSVMEVDEMETRILELQSVERAESDEERESMSASPWKSDPVTNGIPRKKKSSDSLSALKEAVVVLTRLPEYKISALRPPTPEQFYSEDESLSSSDSDMESEPEEPAAVIISSAFAHCSEEITKVRPNLPDEDVRVDMMVLARRRHMRWQWGKIVEIITKEDGRLKYKVSFKEKGKSLVSGHHIAFDTAPRLEQLFLVYLDDHIPVYVGLPLLHLVCRPLEDVLEDLPDGPHKYFMRRYLKDWPCPLLIHYTAGQTLNVELNGVQQKCEVQVVDSSLIQVVFQNNQHKEWIHRGSIRLEHMTRFLELQAAHKDDSD